jgi:hypothetical protein
MVLPEINKNDINGNMSRAMMGRMISSIDPTNFYIP